MTELHDALRQEYRIRVPLKGAKSFIVTLPYEVVEREARRRGVDIEEFIENYRAVAQYDNFEGIHYTFEPAG